MSRLDRYIARRYLANVVALAAALFAFVVAVDVFLNLRRFVEAAQHVREDAKGFELVIVTALMIVDVWGPRLLQLFNYVVGVVLVGGMGFACASFVRAGEFTAMLASGLSLRRLMRPIFVVALAITALAAVNQEVILPRVAHLLPRDPGEAGQRTLQAFAVPLARDLEGRLFYASRFDAEEGGTRLGGTMQRVEVWEPPANRAEGGPVFARRISAESAAWDGSGWALTGGSVVRIGAGGESTGPEPAERIDSDLDPTAILVSQIKGYGQSLSWRQIDRALGLRQGVDAQTRERLERLKFGRLSVMVSNLLALAIAMPFFVLREPKNMAVQSVKAAPLAMLALMGAVLGSAAPLPGLPVWLGVFVPVIALSPIAIWATLSIKT